MAELNTLTASEGKWLTDGTDFVTTISSYGDLSQWREVSASYKNQHTGAIVDLKATKIAEAQAYAESLKAVSFHGSDLWLDPSTRMNYRTALQAAASLGQTEIAFKGITATIEQALQWLDYLEVYAMQVTLTEQGHEEAIQALTTQKAVEAYDYTTGYPTKIEIL